MRISGQIRGNANLIVHGHVSGSIHLDEGLLTVTKKGQVDADVNARVIHVEGRIDGDLQATQTIVVRRTGRVRGSITAPRIALSPECTVNGAVDTKAAEESASTTGNDKAEESASTTGNDKIADIQSALYGTGDRPAKSAMRKRSPR
jgi:cytoskeletal protein CcmA (bactofilin family)